MSQKMLQRLVASLLLLLQVFLMMASVAEEAPLPTPFIGHYEDKRQLRAKPQSGTKILATIDAGSSLYLRPVNDRYAETYYKGVQGYVFYQDAIPQDGRDTPTAPTLAYSLQAESAYGDPHYSGREVAVYPPYTPFLLTAQNGIFVRIETLDGDRQYIASARLIPLEADTRVAPYAAYLAGAAPLLEHPLSSSAALLVAPMSARVQVLAHNGSYALVELEAQGDAEETLPQQGYVLLEQLAAGTPGSEASLFAYLHVAAVVYPEPNRHAFTSQILPAGTLAKVDETAGDFSHLVEMDAFVHTSALTLLEVEPVTPLQGYWDEPQPLYRDVQEYPVATEHTLPAHQLQDIRWRLGEYYLVELEDAWGFAPIQGMQSLEEEALGETVPMVVPKDTPLRAQPLDSAFSAEARKDHLLWVSETVAGHVRITQDGADLYAPLESLLPADVVKSVTPYDGYVEWGATLLDYPHLRGTPVGQVEANTLLRINRQGQEFALVYQGKEKCYIPLASLQPLNAVQDQPDAPKYHILVDKSKFLLTVYLCDDQGIPTDQQVRQATVAIGRRANPTLSGEYTLGSRVRWRYFGPTFAPFAIQYTSGRYLHGPLFHAADDNAIIKSAIPEFGMRKTGGCVRIPYDDMLWIYFHCHTHNTTLHIINGSNAKAESD